jgi:hypothetical protein
MSAQRLTTLAVIRDHLPDKAPIQEVHATIKKVYQPKTGTVNRPGNKMHGKAWKIQTLVLMDAEGTEMDCKVNDQKEDIPRSWEGRDIIIAAYNGDRGTSGVYAHDDDHDGKRKLRLTATADISLVDNGSHAQPGRPAQQVRQEPRQQPRQETHQEQPARRQTQETRQQEPEPPAVDPLVAQLRALGYARGEAFQVANLQLMALTMTEEYTARRFKEKTGRELSADEKHAWAMNMAIDLCKAGVHRQMPACEMQKIETELKSRTETQKDETN